MTPRIGVALGVAAMVTFFIVAGPERALMAALIIAGGITGAVIGKRQRHR